MADVAASVLALRTHSMPLLAHLEELRKRIIFSVLGVLVGFISCWSFAGRIFGLMQQPIIGALRHHGIGGGLVYLNPTEPFNLYLEVALVGGLFVASPFVFYQLWLFIAPGLYRNSCCTNSCNRNTFGWHYETAFILSGVSSDVTEELFARRKLEQNRNDCRPRCRPRCPRGCFRGWCCTLGC
jgi:hypothetical protein